MFKEDAMGYYDSFDCEMQCEDYYQNEEAFWAEEEFRAEESDEQDAA